MTYLPGKITVLDEHQYKALKNIAPEAIDALTPEAKMNILLQHADIRARQREAFWSAVSAAVTVAIPLLAFFGIERWRGRNK